MNDKGAKWVYQTKVVPIQRWDSFLEKTTKIAERRKRPRFKMHGIIQNAC